MSLIRRRPQIDSTFDHGAALRVPPPRDARGRQALMAWLGEGGWPLDDRGAVRVSTPSGPAVARPGDWIVLSVSGHFHVARASSGWDA
jgi:hypothetical protein